MRIGKEREEENSGRSKFGKALSAYFLYLCKYNCRCNEKLSFILNKSSELSTRASLFLLSKAQISCLILTQSFLLHVTSAHYLPQMTKEITGGVTKI